MSKFEQYLLEKQSSPCNSFKTNDSDENTNSICSNCGWKKYNHKKVKL